MWFFMFGIVVWSEVNVLVVVLKLFSVMKRVMILLKKLFVGV